MANVIELSKSSRATCKICKDKIPKGEPRFGKESIFKKGSDEYVSFKWHHFDCAVDKFPKELISADLLVELTGEHESKFNELKKSMSASAFDVKSLKDVTEADKKLSLSTTVARAMAVKEMEDINGDMKIGRSVFITEEVADKKINSKLFLWGDHTSLPVEKGDTIVVVDAITQIASNDKIQFHANEDSKVLLNPSDKELTLYTKNIEIYEGISWNRPAGKSVQFEYAKSSRAKCKICEAKIDKGTLKLIKPVWGENAGRSFPSVDSFHINCSVNDINADEIIHEAITRLTPDMVNDERKILTDLLNILPDNKPREILDSILN